MCAEALNLAKISKVYFGAENDKFGGNGSILTLNREYQVEAGLMKEEAIQLLRSFYEEGNKNAPENKRQRRLK